MTRIAFTLIDGGAWRGGWNYLLNLIKILCLHQKNKIVPVLFFSEECSIENVAPFKSISGVEFVRTSLLDRKRRAFSLMQAIVLGKDVSLQRLFCIHSIDIVFEAAQFFGWRIGIPAIAWITDFQHLVLPEMFSVSARWRRDIGFRAQVLGKRFVMLSSENARQICENHYPKTRGYTRTVHFAVLSDSDMNSKDARNIADGYGLPEHFFYMPNQFWKHKNHVRVVEALRTLRLRGNPMVVVSSGQQKDYRDFGYFNDLQSLVRKYGLENDLYFLGLIPYDHVTALMRASVALLNPSLSEGWSTSVEEARALGVPAILSDLDVHREQMGTQATYFDRYSCQSLAKTLESFQPLDIVQRERQAGEAKRTRELHIKRFSEEFSSLIQYCMGELNK